MNKAEIIYGKTPIFRLYDDGSVEEFVCTGYAEKELWDITEKCYKIGVFVYARNARISSACYAMNSIAKNTFTPLVGESVFFSMEDLNAELALRQEEARNIQRAHAEEIHQFVKGNRRRKR